MDERELIQENPEFKKAKLFIKVIMILFDEFYPNDKLSAAALREKMFCRVKFMDHMHRIAKFM